MQRPVTPADDHAIPFAAGALRRDSRQIGGARARHTVDIGAALAQVSHRLPNVFSCPTAARQRVENHLQLHCSRVGRASGMGRLFSDRNNSDTRRMHPRWLTKRALVKLARSRTVSVAPSFGFLA